MGQKHTKCQSFLYDNNELESQLKSCPSTDNGLKTYTLLSSCLLQNPQLKPMITSSKKNQRVIEKFLKHKYQNYEFTESDLIQYTLIGNLEMFMACCYNLKISEVVGIRGYKNYLIKFQEAYKIQQGKISLDQRSQQSDQSLYNKEHKIMWNPVLFAIERGHLDILRFLVENIKINIKLCLRDPVHTDEQADTEPIWQYGQSKCFAIIICIKQRHQNMFHYLMNDLHQLWSVKELQVIFQQISKVQHEEMKVLNYRETLFNICIGSRTFDTIFQNRCFIHQVEYLQHLVNGRIFDQDDWHDDKIIQILEHKVLADKKKSAAYLAVQIINYCKFTSTSMTIDKLIEILDHSCHDLIAFEKAYFLKVLKLLESSQNRQFKGHDQEGENILLGKFEAIFSNTGKIEEINAKNTIFLNAAKIGNLEKLKQIIEKEKMTEVNQKFYPHEHSHNHHNLAQLHGIQDDDDQDQVKPMNDVDPRLEFFKQVDLDKMQEFAFMILINWERQFYVLNKRVASNNKSQRSRGSIQNSNREPRRSSFGGNMRRPSLPNVSLEGSTPNSRLSKIINADNQCCSSFASGGSNDENEQTLRVSLIKKELFESKSYKNFHYKHQLEWNPMLLAIYKGNFEMVKYLSQKLKVHLRSTIAISKCKRADKEKHAPPLLFCLLSCLMDPKHSNKEQIFCHLWSDFDFVWDYECLLNALLLVLSFRRSDLLDFLMKSWTMQSIFQSFSHNFRIQFVSRFIEGYLYHCNADKKLEKVFRKNLIKVRSYQSTALIFYLYNMSSDKNNDLMGLAMIFVKSKDRLRNIIEKNPAIASCMYRMIEQEFRRMLGNNQNQETTKKIAELKQTFEDVGVKNIMTMEEFEQMDPFSHKTPDLKYRATSLKRGSSYKSNISKASKGDDDYGSVISFNYVDEKLSNNEKYSLLKSNKDIYLDQKSDNGSQNSMLQNQKLKDIKKRTSQMKSHENMVQLPLIHVNENCQILDQEPTNVDQKFGRRPSHSDSKSHSQSSYKRYQKSSSFKKKRNTIQTNLFDERYQ